MKRVIKLLLLAAACGHSGCQSSSRDKGGVIAFAENPENGLRKTVRAGANIYTIQYKPSDYILALERPGSDSLLEQRRQQLDSMVWFNISFRVADFEQSALRYKVTGSEEYNTRLNYYLNDAAKDIYLVYGSDTLYVSSYWFENSQNLTPFETITVGFRLKTDRKPKKDLRLAFYDRVYQNGIIKTIIHKQALQEIPELYTKKEKPL